MYVEIPFKKAASNHTSKRWTKEEDALFVEALNLYGKNWKEVSEFIKTRNQSACLQHGVKLLKDLKKNPSLPLSGIIPILEAGIRIRSHKASKTAEDQAQKEEKDYEASESGNFSSDDVVIPVVDENQNTSL